jgi:hypothetical protein
VKSVSEFDKERWALGITVSTDYQIARLEWVAKNIKKLKEMPGGLGRPSADALCIWSLLGWTVYAIQIWYMDDFFTHGMGLKPVIYPNDVRRRQVENYYINFPLHPVLDKLFEIYDGEQGLRSEPNWEPPKPFTDTEVSDVNGVQYPLNTKHIPEEQYMELRSKGRDVQSYKDILTEFVKSIQEGPLASDSVPKPELEETAPEAAGNPEMTAAEGITAAIAEALVAEWNITKRDAKEGDQPPQKLIVQGQYLAIRTEAEPSKINNDKILWEGDKVFNAYLLPILNAAGWKKKDRKLPGAKGKLCPYRGPNGRQCKVVNRGHHVRHMLSHLPDGIGYYAQCPYYSYVCRRVDVLQEHMESQHEDLRLDAVVRNALAKKNIFIR